MSFLSMWYKTKINLGIILGDFFFSFLFPQKKLLYPILHYLVSEYVHWLWWCSEPGLDILESTVYNVNWEVWRLKCALWSVPCAEFCVQCVVWSLKCGKCIVQCAVFSKQCAMFSVQCTLCHVKCAVCTVSKYCFYFHFSFY